MIFIDSGAIYAIFDKRDTNHNVASLFFESNVNENSFIITTPILVECWFLIESRLGNYYSKKFLEAVNSHIFNLREITYIDFVNALKIEKTYSDINFGLVDCLSFSYIERNKIRSVFTFDRKHYNIYSPVNLKFLNILP